ncbi:MAG TPA: MrtC family glutamic-type intramembrane protease [Polyangiaceae bacterium]|nr:MrtC family glutamic-type intramembrane protease [Polyangiaceae bacterium]
MLPKSEEPHGSARRGHTSAWLAIGVTVATTAVVTCLSYGLPEQFQATGVGLAFLAATYVLVLRHDSETVRRHGLALGGLFDSAPLSSSALLKSAGGAVAWAFAAALVVLPPFWFGWLEFWQPDARFSPASLRGVLDDAAGQLLVIALPEECFYRGYLQSSLDEAWHGRVRLLGAEVGPSLVVTSALFAAGHLATELDVNRLAVFFPALLFGWLRARTGGVGAGIVLHALCNLFAAYLARSYGLAR